MPFKDAFGGLEVHLFGRTFTARLLALICGSAFFAAVSLGIFLGLVLKPKPPEEDADKKPGLVERLFGKWGMAVAKFIATAIQCLLPPASYLYNVICDFLFLISVMRSFGGFEAFGKAIWDWNNFLVNQARAQATRDFESLRNGTTTAESVDYVRQGLPEFVMIVGILTVGGLFSMYIMAYYFPKPQTFLLGCYSHFYNLAGSCCMRMYSPSILMWSYYLTYLLLLAPIMSEVLLVYHRIVYFRDPRWVAAFTAREHLEFWGQTLPILCFSTALFLDGYADARSYVMLMAGGVLDAFGEAKEKARLFKEKGASGFNFVFPQDVDKSRKPLRDKLELAVLATLCWCPWVTTGVAIFSIGDAIEDMGMTIAGLSVILSGFGAILFIEIHAWTDIGTCLRRRLFPCFPDGGRDAARAYALEDDPNSKLSVIKRKGSRWRSGFSRYGSQLGSRPGSTTGGFSHIYDNTSFATDARTASVLRATQLAREASMILTESAGNSASFQHSESQVDSEATPIGGSELLLNKDGGITIKDSGPISSRDGGLSSKDLLNTGEAFRFTGKEGGIGSKDSYSFRPGSQPNVSRFASEAGFAHLRPPGGVRAASQPGSPLKPALKKPPSDPKVAKDAASGAHFDRFSANDEAKLRAKLATAPSSSTLTGQEGDPSGTSASPELSTRNSAATEGVYRPASAAQLWRAGSGDSLSLMAAIPDCSHKRAQELLAMHASQDGAMNREPCGCPSKPRDSAGAATAGAGSSRGSGGVRAVVASPPRPGGSGYAETNPVYGGIPTGRMVSESAASGMSGPRRSPAPGAFPGRLAVGSAPSWEPGARMASHMERGEEDEEDGPEVGEEDVELQPPQQQRM